MEPTREKIAGLQNPHEWILQRRVDYAAFVPTIDGRHKCRVIDSPLQDPFVRILQASDFLSVGSMSTPWPANE